MIKAFFATIVLALLSYTSATPCTDVCIGSCEGYEDIMNLFFPQFVDFTTNNVEACKLGCDQICSCKDACSDQCDPDYQACIADAGYLISTLTCQYRYAFCSVPCNTQCSWTTLLTAIQGALQFVVFSLQSLFETIFGLFGLNFDMIAPTSASL